MKGHLPTEKKPEFGEGSSAEPPGSGPGRAPPSSESDALLSEPDASPSWCDEAVHAGVDAGAARAFHDGAATAHAAGCASGRNRSAAKLSLDLADAFQGLALCVAIERRRGRDAAFVLLDQASLLRGRNHHCVLRRELEKVRALLDVVPGPVAPVLSSLLENPDGPDD